MNHVFHEFKCNKVECNFSTYIGHTKCFLHEWFEKHTQTRTIIQHRPRVYNITRVPQRELFGKTEVIATAMDKRCLVILEDLPIKERKHNLISQVGCDGLLESFIQVPRVTGSTSALPRKSTFALLTLSYIFTLDLFVALCTCLEDSTAHVVHSTADLGKISG